ncbi:hypothetical protein DAPPUDRAFT_327242 [Daphnia pulex]|uniref:FAM69 protein-kinase domain-containing protein n=1 Tax=Daphnia pulex TaxID=6669 RepID=E9HA61_DAPPU|nr:hypothetical protein DAPPUDRAFT_327242 [Daphnia pulex]|eukprot:EFX71406.1 hypothetical protein DAPPUDRAFT_327242 [Daphnia pulex]
MTPLLVWIVTLGVFSTALLRSAIPIYLNVADEKFLELKKCPACYGVMLCPAFLMGDIVPETWSRFKAAQLLNTKNVYFATFKDKHVVMKKLGHDPQLEQLDHHILQQSVGLLNNPIQQVSVSAAVRPYTQQNVWLDCVKDLEGNGSTLVHRLRVFDPSSQDIISNDLQRSVGSFRGSDMLMCPSQRKLNYIENEFVKNNFGLYRLTCLYNLMTLLLLNSEPLIFQTFPAKEGWPFPIYYGACGRVVVEEYVGPNLAQWLPQASWKERINAALQLLIIADKFTNGAADFRLYLTDLSLFNTAVGSDGTLKIVDGENIVMVDLEKIRKDRPENFDVPYASDNAGCEHLPFDPHCMSYSEQDMCNRLHNDHNFFAVCRELFSPLDSFGLANGLPEKILKRFPLIPVYQTDCYSSTIPGVRKSAAKNLISIYKEILADV